MSYSIMEIKKYLFKEINLDRLNNKWLIFTLKIASYAALSAYLLHVSWQAWPDITVDFGNELYMPWRVIQGDAIYKDIDYYFGAPLSIYWNAFWFKLFGPSLNTLIIVNISLLMVLIFLLENWLKEIGDEFLATIGILFFITVFAFNRYVQAGNYNFITPYSHPLTHGLIIILIALTFMRKWEKTHKATWLFLVGLAVGMAIISKFEIAITIIATVGAYLVAIFYTNPKLIFNKKTITLFIAIPIPLLLAIFMFSRIMPIEVAVRGILSQWIMLLDGRVSKINELLFYKNGMGINNIPNNLFKLLAWSWAYINIALIGIFSVLVLKNIKNWRLIISTLIILATAASTHFLILKQTWFELARPLPLFMFIGITFSICQIIRKRNILNMDLSWPLCLASFVFAETMLLKMFLNTRIYHYGFVLAAPATLILIVISLGWFSDLIERRGYQKWPFKVFIAGVIFSVAFIHILISSNTYSRNDFPITINGEAILTNKTQGLVIQKTLEELQTRLIPNQTMVVLPEGVMLNYLLKHRNPTPYITFMPDLFIMNSEQKIIDSFAKNPPDFIILVHKNTDEYGYRFFGKDYAIHLYDWINKNYKTVWETEQKPFEPTTIFGVAIKKYNDPKL